MNTNTDEKKWTPSTTVEELSSSRMVVVELNGIEVLLLWNDGAPTALANVCIHKGRSLAQGFLLGDRLVCPGHQWAFNTTTGFCKERDRYQPVFPARIEGNKIEVDVGLLDLCDQA